MKTNSITDFAKFEIGKTQLDKIVGAKTAVDYYSSGTGIGAGGQTVKEFIYMYDDGSWQHYYLYSAC